MQITAAILNYTIEENEENWVGVIILSLPLTIQFINGVFLLITNVVIRRGLKLLVTLKHDSKVFASLHVGTKTGWHGTNMHNVSVVAWNINSNINVTTKNISN